MSSYYIDTASGPRGPYPAQQIINGVQQGRIPTNATLRDADTGQTLRAVDLTAQPAPADSGGYAPVSQPAGPSPQFMPQRPPQPQYQAQQPQYPQPRYPQGQYPQTGPAYPQQYSQPYPPQPPQHYGQYPSPGACLPLCIVGIILGIMALNECQPNGPKRGRGLALGGIWTGVGILLLMVLVIGLMVAVR